MAASRRQTQRRSRSRTVTTLRIEALEERAVLATMVPLFTHPHPGGSLLTPAATSGPTGTMAAAMRTAYGMDSITFGSVAGTGAGQTIAIVDAYDWPSMTTDMATFNARMGLPSCTLIKVNQTGQTTNLPAADAKGGWGVETAMDVEWAHAMAPQATILLVEANSANDADLYTAVDTARNWPGVSAVSMSWGGDETSADSANDYHFTTPAGHTGVTFFSSSGDNGKYSGAGTSTVIAGYPAVSPNVVAVGGTNLTMGAGNVWSSETGWGNGTSSMTSGGSGGGVSKYAAEPTYQRSVVPTSMSGSSSPKRVIPDIAADADPATGASVCSSYDYTTAAPWDVIGGTSLSSPLWAGMMAVFNQGRVANGLASMDGRTEFLPKLYALPAADFHDITSGNNGYAAGAGYDMVTGFGSPIGPKLAADLAANAAPTPSIGGFTVSPTSVTAGASFTLTASNVAETGGTITAVRFYRESNGSVGLQIGSDVLVGTGTQAGSTWTLTVSSSGLAAGSSTFYAVATDASSVSTAASTATLTVTAPVTPTLPAVTIAGASILEGNYGTRSLAFIVALATAAKATATVAYATADGTAVASSDYIATHGTVTFRVGQRTATIVVPVRGDTTPEANETFTVTLSSPVGCTLGAVVTATGTILNDDGGTVVAPAFTANGSAIATAIAKVPTGVGALTSVSIVDFGTTIYTGSIDVTNTLNRIRAGGRSLDANDGSVYGNSNGALSPKSGTWFEFVVDPMTGTNRSFSSVTFPGPMRMLLNTDGTTYFTGNHYASFVSVWKPGSLPVPTIGTFTVSPTTVVVGGVFALTAAGVTETGGSVTAVKFYRETNGTSGLQPTGDTLVGAGVQSGTTWTFTTTAAGLVSGSYTYYAVASDAAATASTVVSAVLAVTNPPAPAIGAFSVSPAAVTVGGSTTLTASNVVEVGGSVRGVTFYRETNGTPGLQPNADTVVGAGVQSGTTWTLTTSAAGFTAGSYAYYAVAADPSGVTSPVASAVLSVTNPTTAAVPVVSIAGVSLTEGTGGTKLFSFVVSLTAPARTTVTVAYRTGDGTATAGSDYVTSSGVLTFRVGQRTATVAVPVVCDAVVEADETFAVQLLNPVGATLGIATAVGTILNDDTMAAQAAASTPATKRVASNVWASFAAPARA